VFSSLQALKKKSKIHQETDTIHTLSPPPQRHPHWLGKNKECRHDKPSTTAALLSTSRSSESSRYRRLVLLLLETPSSPHAMLLACLQTFQWRGSCSGLHSHTPLFSITRSAAARILSVELWRSLWSKNWSKGDGSSVVHCCAWNSQTRVPELTAAAAAQQHREREFKREAHILHPRASPSLNNPPPSPTPPQQRKLSVALPITSGEETHSKNFQVPHGTGKQLA
jgi:hypothetical protein